MLRKTLLFTLLALAFASLNAQNLQLHFDPRGSIYGKDHFSTGNYLTATFEMFKPDKWGSTFMFVDADFNLEKGNIGLMYTEIAREFKINNFPLMPHIEFNGGLGLFDMGENAVGGYRIENAYLAGFGYPFQVGKAFMSTYVAYKMNAFKKTSHDVQWTVTWNANLCNNKFTLSGFADLWTENKSRIASGDKKVVFLSEPQFWYNATDQFSVGSEIEISSNFGGKSRAYVCPTLAAKWIF